MGKGDLWEVANRIASTDDFVALPTKFDVHDWQIMRDFAESVKSTSVRQGLLEAKHGSRAFRHFKDTVARCGIEEQWYKFRDDALKQIAVAWCAENDVEWT